MRILFVHDRFGAMAGAEVNLLVTARELKNRGHSLAILHGPSTGRAEAEWIRVFEKCYSLSSGNSSVAEVIRDFEPDAVYVHKMADLSVLRDLADSAVPVARMVHDHDLYCLRSYKYSPFSRRICTRAAGWHCVFPCGAVLARDRSGGLPFKWMSFTAKRKELRINRKFNRMIVATDYMKQELLRNGFAPERVEIHAPVPPPADDAPPSNFSDRNLLIFAGQVIRGKGVDVLLESLVQVSSKFECVILGEGHHRAHCEQLSQRLGLGSCVRFLGYVPPAAMAEFYGEATLAVVSSVWPEPFGAVGLEAMRFGVPVVAFDAGGIREWLSDGENGFLVPWMDRRTFAQRVDQLLADKALARRLGQNGRRIVRERFAFEDYIDGLEQMFARMVQREQTAVAS